VKRFKEGAFLLAQQDASFDSTNNNRRIKGVLPKPGIVNLFQTFTIKVLPEIPYESFKDISASELAKQVNRLIEETHREMAPEWYR
jgi:hypothetical protein